MLCLRKDVFQPISGRTIEFKIFIKIFGKVHKIKYQNTQVRQTLNAELKIMRTKSFTPMMHNGYFYKG